MSSWQRKRPGRPSHATVVAYAALFVAFTGTAWAAATVGSGDIKNDAVRSRHIKQGQVKAQDLHVDSVSSDKIADGSIGSADIADNSVSSDDVSNNSLTDNDLATSSVATTELADHSVTSDDLAPDSVGTNEVAPNSLTSTDLGTNSVGSTELGASSVRASEIAGGVVARTGTPVNIAGGTAENGAYSVDHATASCNAGEQLIGGMGRWSGADNEALDLELWIAEIEPNFAANSVTVTGGNDSGANRALIAIAICMQA